MIEAAIVSIRHPSIAQSGNQEHGKTLMKVTVQKKRMTETNKRSNIVFKTRYDKSLYDPSDVVEWGDMGSDISANHGNSLQAKQVAYLPDGSAMVHTDLSHFSITIEDAERQMVGYEALKHIDPDRTIINRADISTNGFFANAVAPGVDAIDTSASEQDAVDRDSFVDMAAAQVIIGNADVHQRNVRVDAAGNLIPFDLDRAGGDIQAEWVGVLSQYQNTLDRTLGELEKTASALRIETAQRFRREVLEQAEQIATSLSEQTINDIERDSATWNESMAHNIRSNIEALRAGTVDLV